MKEIVMSTASAAGLELHDRLFSVFNSVAPSPSVLSNYWTIFTPTMSVVKFLDSCEDCNVKSKQT